ncbi:hypothetical protein [Hamadaea tsunoensis]|uniref:hypothetical protein n=1 Tax=Hamadaea tsunoensis TaxID=53368 RepID=UPI00040E7E6C|nr:hypothetical protein [Hamadaea tsunoensis]
MTANFAATVGAITNLEVCRTSTYAPYVTYSGVMPPGNASRRTERSIIVTPRARRTNVSDDISRLAALAGAMMLATQGFAAPAQAAGPPALFQFKSNLVVD